MFHPHCLWLHVFWTEEKALVTKAGTEKDDSLTEIICLFSQKDVNSFYMGPHVCVISKPAIHLLFSQKMNVL